VGVGMIGVAGSLDYAAWTARGGHDPWHLLGTGPFDFGVLVVAAGLLFLGSTIPWWSRPGFRIVCGNSPGFRRDRVALPEENDLFQNSSHVEVHVTCLRVTENRNHWAENVYVQVVSVDPPLTDHDPPEYLSWWTPRVPPQYETFAPGHKQWAVLHTQLVPNNDSPMFVGLSASNASESTATLAVRWEGRIMDTIKIQLSGVGPDNPYPMVSEIGRPSIRSVNRELKQRDS
jgi:hypothetical protein